MRSGSGRVAKRRKRKRWTRRGKRKKFEMPSVKLASSISSSLKPSSTLTLSAAKSRVSTQRESARLSLTASTLTASEAEESADTAGDKAAAAAAPQQSAALLAAIAAGDAPTGTELKALDFDVGEHSSRIHVGSRSPWACQKTTRPTPRSTLDAMLRPPSMPPRTPLLSLMPLLRQPRDKRVQMASRARPV